MSSIKKIHSYLETAPFSSKLLIYLVSLAIIIFVIGEIAYLFGKSAGNHL